MAHYGRLFFDFTVPKPPKNKKHWTESDLKKMQRAVEWDIERKDPWDDGLCARNQWLNLWDIPAKHGKMVRYCNRKLKGIKKYSVKAEEDPPQPIAYCYSGDSRICYHPHALSANKKPWTVPVKSLKVEIEMVIVLSYETVCFS